jgi:hypothetical protein
LAIAALILGILIGLKLPAWVGWPIDHWATAVAGALVFGVITFAADRIVQTGVFVLALLAVAIAATWIGFAGNAGVKWMWPTLSDATIQHYSGTVYQSLPGDVGRVLPLAAGIALIVAFTIAILWPRIALVISWSLVGIMTIVLPALADARGGHRMWMDLVPTQAWAQILLLAMLIALGAVVQWTMLPTRQAIRARTDTSDKSRSAATARTPAVPSSPVLKANAA